MPIMDKVYPPHKPLLETALQEIAVTYGVAGVHTDRINGDALDKVSTQLVMELVSVSPGLQRLSVSVSAAGTVQPFRHSLGCVLESYLESDCVADALKGRGSPLPLLRVEAAAPFTASAGLRFGGRVRRLELSAPEVRLPQSPPSNSFGSGGSSGAGGGGGGSTSGTNSGGTVTGGGGVLSAGPESIRICAGDVLFMGDLKGVREFLECSNVSFGEYAGRAPSVSVEAPQLYGLHNGGAHRLRLLADYRLTMQMLQARIEEANA